MPGRYPLCLLLLAVTISACTFGVPLATSEPPAEPAPRPTPTATSGPRDTPGSSGLRTDAPTASPSPSPTPDPAAMDLEVTGCEGGVVLDWSASADPAFHHYTALRSPVRQIEPDYPPIAPAVDWGDTYATDRFVTTAVDASIIPSATTWFYRVMAYNVAGAVVGGSPVRSGRMADVADLGGLVVAPAGDGVTRIEWRPYSGFSRCFTSYRILFGIGAAPSEVLTVVSDQATSSIQTRAFHAGTSYQVAVRAVRDTTLGTLVVGRTEVVSYTAP